MSIINGKKSAWLIMGPPYSGKGSQSRKLEQKGIGRHLSTGDMFRNMRRDTDIGKEALDLIEQGNYATDDIVMKIFDEYSAKQLEGYNPETQHVILDGIPRTAPQVEFINERFHVERIIRLIVPYSLLELRSQSLEEGRKDDEGLFKHRMDLYFKNTVPLFNMYDSSLVYLVKGTGTLEEVHARILP